MKEHTAFILSLNTWKGENQIEAICHEVTQESRATDKRE